jgi:hypothetical protein
MENEIDIDKEIEYAKWLKQNKVKKKIEDYVKDWEEKASKKENYIDFPLTIDKTPEGKIVKKALCTTKEYYENIEYCLFSSINSETGRISIQYVGEDNTFLTHKEIIKAIKIENKI